jgi:diadenosine tetraphosphate (Ap4A) HIT family hydrolase
MHWHIVPRSSTDPLWPRPHWSEPHRELFLESDGYRERVELIRSQLAKG